MLRFLRSATAVALLLSSELAAQTSAKALFYGPKLLDQYGGIRFVGIRYWFESAAGKKFVNASAAPKGTRVRLHIQGNVAAFLTVWFVDEVGRGRQLTPMVDQYGGVVLEAGEDYVVPGDFTGFTTGAGKSRLLIWFARSQTEQVGDAADAQSRIQRVSATMARDGAPALIREIDADTPAQLGTYVVHREGGQTGAEIDVGS